jgi:hypothetical protein
MVGGGINGDGQGRGVYRWTCTCKRYARIGTCYKVVLARFYIDEEHSLLASFLHTIGRQPGGAKNSASRARYPRLPGETRGAGLNKKQSVRSRILTQKA